MAERGSVDEMTTGVERMRKMPTRRSIGCYEAVAHVG